MAGFTQRLLIWISFLSLLINALPRPKAQWRADSEDEGDEEYADGNYSRGGIVSTAAPSAVNGSQLYFLTQGGNGRIARMSPEGGPVTTVLGGLDHAPDGIAVDKEGGYIYFSNMRPGSIQRARLDGSQLTTLFTGNGFQVGKQLVLVLENGVKKLYWADREGMKVMRSGVDGKNVEVLVDTSRDRCAEPECKNAVGVAVDEKNGFFYWTQKSRGGFGSIHRAPVKFKAGETAANRTDAQPILRNLPEPIDLRWVDGFGLYWTDRGHQTGGNSVNRMRMSQEVMGGVARFPERSAPLVTGLKEGIGIAIDTAGGRIFVTDLGGNVYRSKLDGSAFTTLASGQGIAVGIDYVP
jgi:hypothetical protein